MKLNTMIYNIQSNQWTTMCKRENCLKRSNALCINHVCFSCCQDVHCRIHYSYHKRLNTTPSSSPVNRVNVDNKDSREDNTVEASNTVETNEMDDLMDIELTREDDWLVKQYYSLKEYTFEADWRVYWTKECIQVYLKLIFILYIIVWTWFVMRIK